MAAFFLFFPAAGPMPGIRVPRRPACFPARGSRHAPCRVPAACPQKAATRACNPGRTDGTALSPAKQHSIRRQGGLEAFVPFCGREGGFPYFPRPFPNLCFLCRFPSLHPFGFRIRPVSLLRPQPASHPRFLLCLRIQTVSCHRPFRSVPIHRPVFSLHCCPAVLRRKFFIPS